MTNIIDKRDTNPAGPLTGNELIYLGQDSQDAVATLDEIKAYIAGEYVGLTSTNPFSSVFVSGAQLITDVDITIDDSTPRSGFFIFCGQSNNWPEGLPIRIRVVSNADIALFHIQDAFESDLPLADIALLTAPVDVTFLYAKRAGNNVLMARSGI